MGILVALRHVTSYRYDHPIGLGPQTVRLCPAPYCRTRVPSYSLKVSPARHFVNWQQDPLGNSIARIVLPERTRSFEVEVELTAEMVPINPFDFFIEPYAEEFPFAYPDELAGELAPYLETAPGGEKLSAFLASLPKERRRTVDFLVELNARVHGDVRYVVRMEPGVQEPEETLSLGSGSCRDCAWLLVQVLRRLGVAARFVSGYLIQLKADLDPLEGPKGPQRRLHRSARLGRGLYPRRRLDRLRRDVGPAVRRRPPPAGRRTALPLRRADHRRRRARRRSISSFEMHVSSASRSDRASPSRSRTRAGPRSMRSATQVEATCGAGCAADHGGRADLRLHRRFRGGRMEHRPRSARPSRRLPTSSFGGCGTVSRPAACCITARANGTRAKPAALGLRAVSGATTASRSGAMIC